ncbi:hypothetical protein RKD46_003546 [Streptomyces pseudovenezuelae]
MNTTSMERISRLRSWKDSVAAHQVACSSRHSWRSPIPRRISAKASAVGTRKTAAPASRPPFGPPVAGSAVPSVAGCGSAGCAAAGSGAYASCPPGYLPGSAYCPGAPYPPGPA